MNHALKAIYLHMTYEIHADREAIFEPSLQAVAPAYMTTGRGFGSSWGRIIVLNHIKTKENITSIVYTPKLACSLY